MRTQAREVEAKALDAVFAGDETVTTLVRESSELSRQAKLLQQSIARHRAYTQMDARRATLDAALALTDADIQLIKINHASTLNEVLSAMKQLAVVNGGQVKLDPEALYTGRIRELQIELSRLETEREHHRKRISEQNTDAKAAESQYETEYKQ